MPTDGVLFSAHQFQALWSPLARYIAYVLPYYVRYSICDFTTTTIIASTSLAYAMRNTASYNCDLRARIRFLPNGPRMCVLVVWPGIVPDNHPLAGQVRLTRCRGTMGAPTPGREADRPVAFLTTLPTLEDRRYRED